MVFDWQTIIVALLILGALVYVGRRGLARLHSLRVARGNAASCDTGCGSCASSTPSATTLGNTLIQIKRPGTSSNSK